MDCNICMNCLEISCNCINPSTLILNENVNNERDRQSVIRNETINFAN